MPCLGIPISPTRWQSHARNSPEWIQVNVQMLEYFEGVPLVVVPDNLRSAVTKSGREPLINRTYEDMARHYDLVVLPARARKRRIKVEGGVLIAQRMIAGPSAQYEILLIGGAQQRDCSARGNSEQPTFSEDSRLPALL